MSVGGALEVEAGLVEGDARDLQPAAPERHDAKRRGDAGALQDRLRAEARGRVHDEVGDLYAGARQQLQRDAGDLDRMPERSGEAGGDLALVAADVDERRQHQSRDQQEDACDRDEQTAAWPPARVSGSDRNSGSDSGDPLGTAIGSGRINQRTMWKVLRQRV